MFWSPQLTVPMPLEAIHEIFSNLAVSRTQGNPIVVKTQQDRNIVYVAKDFFQLKPSGVAPEDVKDDVLSFLSLVVSYTKGAVALIRTKVEDIDLRHTPTDFTSTLSQVKAQIPHVDDLYGLVKLLTNGVSVEYSLRCLMLKLG